MEAYKVVVIGDADVGKTTFVHRHYTGEFEKKYFPTKSVDVNTLPFETNYGLINFEIWDCAGQEKLRGLGDGFFINSQGCILMFDLSCKYSLENVERWFREFKRVSDAPVVLCGTKSDIENREVDHDSIIECLRKLQAFDNRVRYYEISSKTNYNYDKPFLELSRVLKNNTDIRFY